MTLLSCTPRQSGVAPLLALALNAALVGPALAQDGAEAAPSGPEELMSVRFAGIESLFAHPKDQGLLRMARLLDDRLAELPMEVPDLQGMPPQVLQLLTELVLGSHTISIALDPSVDPGQDMPLRGGVTFHQADAQSAQDLMARVVGLLRDLGAPELERDANGRLLIPAEIPATLGASGADVSLDIGGAGGPGLAFGDPALPAGARHLGKLRYDYGTLVDMMLGIMAQEAGPEQADMMYEMFARLGLDQLELEISAAATGDTCHTIVRMPGWASSMREAGLMGDDVLARTDLAVVPGDATWASVQKVNFQGGFDAVMGFVRDLMEREGQSGDPLEQIEAMTGFHPKRDFIDVLGGTLGMYASDTTGGGGMLSTVLFMSLADATRALETRERLEEMLNGLAAMETEGYVQIRPWTHGDVEMSTVIFPGLPVPLEPTVAITDGWMFIAASASAAVAAVDHAAAGGAGLTAHPALAGANLAGAQSMSFQDTARLARDGYGTMAMLASGLANGVRSRVDGARDASPVLPPFATLLEGVQPSLSIGGASGDDFVVRSQADASVAVQGAALCGWMQSSGALLLAPLVAGVAAESGVSSSPVYYEEEWTEEKDY